MVAAPSSTFPPPKRIGGAPSPRPERPPLHARAREVTTKAEATPPLAAIMATVPGRWGSSRCQSPEGSGKGSGRPKQGRADRPAI